MTTMGKVDTSDLIMMIRRVMNILFQSPKLEWASSTHATLYMQKGNWKTNPILDTLATWYTRQAFLCSTRASIKQNHMAVAYFPWYFTRRPAWKPRPRRGSGFHAGSASEVSWKICNNKCGFVFIPRLYPWIYQATHITHLDWLPKYDFEPCRLQVFKQM